MSDSWSWRLPAPAPPARSWDDPPAAWEVAGLTVVNGQLRVTGARTDQQIAQAVEHRWWGAMAAHYRALCVELQLMWLARVAHLDDEERDERAARLEASPRWLHLVAEERRYHDLEWPPS